MSRTFAGGNSLESRAISGKQRHEEEYYTPPTEDPVPEGMLVLLESAHPTMTKAALLDVIERAIVKAGG